MNKRIEISTIDQDGELYMNSFFLLNLYRGPFSKEALINLSAQCIR